MFASLAALALAAQQIRVPIGPKPRQVERARAPIEVAGPQWAAACKDRDGWDDPAPPVRIHGNAYLVGTCGVAAILVTGRDGHVLIDSGTEKGADLVLANIRALGFRPKDVRILLHSHEHLDHVGGMAVLQQATGAQLFASPTAAKVFATGAATPDDPQAGMHPPIRAARVDRIIRNGEEVRLGGINLVPIETPGHTPGALSWRFVACDGGVCRTIVYADSMNPISRDDYRFSDHPDYVAAFRAGIARLAGGECDILVTPHPSASAMPARLKGDQPWQDPTACRAYADGVAERLDARLAKEAGQ